MSEKANLLILTSYFYPENIIGAIRLSKLYKVLNNQGNFNITIIHTKTNEVNFEDSILRNDITNKDAIKVIEKSIVSTIIRKYKRILGNQKRSPALNNSNTKDKRTPSCKTYSLSLGFVRKSLSLASHTIEILVESIDARETFKEIQRMINFHQIDVVYSTYSPLNPHFIASKIKKTYPKINWIAEFRDPVFQYNTPKLLHKFSKGFISKRSKYIDLLVYPTEGYLKHLYVPSSMDKLLLRNGYDSDDILNFDLFKNKTSSELTICLAGSYYPRVSLLPLFLILNSMIKNRMIEATNLRFIYVGTETQRIKGELSTIENIVPTSLLSLMTRSDVFNNVYSISDIVINLSHNNSDFDDILTGKFFELLMLKKPLIAFTFGNGDNKELYEIIEKTKIGIVIENNKLQKDSTLIIDFIKKIYDHKFNGLAYFHEPNIEALEEYEYKNVFNKLIDYINSLSRGEL